MALDPDSYLPKFFTRDRLAWYRELHSQYPAWCGAWGDKTQDLEEYGPWDPHRRLLDHARLGQSLPVLLQARPRRSPSEAFIPGLIPVFFGTPNPGGTWTAPRPLLSAILYISHPWHLPVAERNGRPERLGPEEMLNRWTRLLEGHLSVRSLDASETSFGLELAHERAAVLGSGGGQRKHHQKRLRKIWSELGEAIGVIPTIARGTVLQLRGEPLARLLDQGASLIQTATSYSVSEEEMRITRETMQTVSGLDGLTLERIRSLQRQGLNEEADRIQTGKLRALLSDEEVLLYATWLRFPIFNHGEARDIVSRPSRDSDALCSLALDFVLRRCASVGLVLDRTTVQKAARGGS